MSKNDHIDWLRKQLAERERCLAQAEAEVEKWRPIVMNLRGAIDALSEPGGGKAKDEEKKEKPPTSIGARTLSRNPEFESLSTIAAVRRILQESGEPIHRDDLARKIFKVGDNSDFIKAQRSLSSQLSSGTKKEYWKALGGGRYASA